MHLLIAYRFKKAKAQLLKGNAAPMQALAHASLGDAWIELIEAYKRQSAPESHITHAMAQALTCTTWITHAQGLQEEYNQRCFYGIGTAPNYQALLTEWHLPHVSHPGYGHEIQLAWIHTFGLPTPNIEEAWWWLCLAQVRGRLNREALPPPVSDTYQLKAYLEQLLSQHQKQHIEQNAKGAAEEETRYLR